MTLVTGEAHLVIDLDTAAGCKVGAKGAAHFVMLQETSDDAGQDADAFVQPLNREQRRAQQRAKRRQR